MCTNTNKHNNQKFQRLINIIIYPIVEMNTFQEENESVVLGMCQNFGIDICNECKYNFCSLVKLFYLYHLL